ncbi:pyridoxamine 5'-phosphate oxidase family protein [Nigerium massiliense]|uniref:pyridoxamine 5'-phosphate oxidase family protein n=1 Tax=Nigerium massiliense TaxID=1522317 RepID=UPI00058AF195|nr:pyridoxamine 5'-phosphate oxidase family protein [Nigerium massiliense]
MTGYFEPIESTECLRLLHTVDVGRIGWVAEAGMELFPVNLAADDGSLFLKVSKDSKLAELARGKPVVVEADDIDPQTATGWSVVARGRATRHERALPPTLPRPWAPGERELLIRVDVTAVSGRAISADEPRP